jgi:hypothetical protein
MPYVEGTFQGTVNGNRAQVNPSGLADARVRFAVNLIGGPAMHLKEFRQWREKTLFGFSFTARVPISQYDRARLMNPGTNRWAFKPELGVSRRWGRWVAEGYAGMWLFTANSNFYPGNVKRTQRPMGATEGHLGYYLAPFFWASLDGNFWTGGSTSRNGVANTDAQRESRLGVTVSLPIAAHQTVKASYSQGAFTRLGGDFRTLSVAWQYSWIRQPR